jgi:2-oxoisovalerate dehydrogenase E1 component
MQKKALNSTAAAAIDSSISADCDERAPLKAALTARLVEEELLRLFSQGKLNGTVHTCIGQEFSGAQIIRHLWDQDTVFSNHRCHGHYLARTDDVEGLIAELMGRATGTSGGLGGSQHLCRDGFFSNGIQGGIVPVAAGLALAHKIRGEGHLSCVFIGDGTLGEGVVYETLNIAAKWELPLLVVLEDNLYSQSTSQQETLAGEVSYRARAFGIEYARADTWNHERLATRAREFIGAIRTDSKPRLLHVDTYRLKAHSKGDDTRARDIVQPWEERDPLNIFLADVPAADRPWVEAIRARIAKAVEQADKAPPARANLPTADEQPVRWQRAPEQSRKRVVNALNEALMALMAADESIHFIGEDVLSPYGGAFKVSKDLSDRFPGRVRNTPISEAAIVGIGTGMGLLGLRPLVEIMFGDFVGLAFDQVLNHAAKFRQMYNEQVHTNVILRTPMGGGRGYGPTHSQSLEKHFLGIPGLRILAMNHLTHPSQLYAPLVGQVPGPTLVIENKLLYGTYLAEAAPEGFELRHSTGPFPVAQIKPTADTIDVTLLGYGGTSEILVQAAETLFEQHDIIAQVICVMQIHPFSVKPLLDELTAAPNLMILEEGQGFAGFGAEVLAQLAELGVAGALKIARLHPPAFCIPSSGPLEKELLPDADKLVAAVLAMEPV